MPFRSVTAATREPAEYRGYDMEYKAWKLAAVGLLFLTFFPRFGYGEVGNADSHRADPVIPGQFIIVVNGGFDPAQVASDHAAIPLHVYRVASRGFAARLSNAQVNALRRDPRVNNVVADRKVTTAAKPVSGGGGTVETIPTGIKRIDAEAAGGSNSIVAIIDTGIDLDHPDLNVSTRCGFTAYSGTPDDGNGHGTHVAGTVAAKANGIGVRGVAPGTELCPVKVLHNSGSGSWASVIRGIEYVTRRRTDDGLDIKVANMSLGSCASVVFIWCVAEPPPENNNCGVAADGTVRDPLHQAICNSARAGIVYSVASGNDDEDALYFVPAAYPEVVTVSAFADYNGQGGGGAKAPKGCNYGADDSLATFSNYGETVDIAAPGVCILSTYKGGGTKTLSGTSMATPHVTGAIALADFTVSPSGNEYAARDSAMNALKTKPQASFCGFSADSDSDEEPVVYIGAPDTDCGP